MASITIIALHDVSEDLAKPKMFLQQGNIWRDISSVTPIDPADIRALVDIKLKNVMNDVDRKLKRDEAITSHRGTLAKLGSRLRNMIVPDQLTNRLREVNRHYEVQEANGQDPDPPILYVHMQPHLDWIPWEILFDRDLGSGDFFGSRFQIVRLPIVTAALSFEGNQTRTVQRIHSILGKKLLDQGSPDLDNWHNTFAGLAGLNGHTHSFPSLNNPNDFRNVEELMDLPECDIWHFTCHGITEGDEYFFRLDDDPQQIDDWKIDKFTIGLFGLANKRPLIFGNACSSTEALDQNAKDQLSGLGLTCLEKGASAYIGTFAPISSQLATRFAKEFYHQLLDKGLPIGHALFATKQKFAAEPDPSWMFYRFYGSPDTRFVMA